ncbi:TonB-dependent receptor [Hymenobacter terrenus]|uniref:TonB-dependent receptor n=1 Tax=Hymenobacter terrenus TaxID=1629124 RepID=UPI000619FBD7|nr:carboxypeptidase-like regulatory domain-containing protein [Hymenobacter terrenus]
MKNICYLIFGCLLALSLHPLRAQAQQTVTLTGTVRSEAEGALPGATVFIQGTYIGGSANSEGQFKIDASQATFPLVLTVSFVGYLTQQFPVRTADGALNIVLQPSTTLTNEVVVSASRTEENIQRAPVTVEKLNEVQLRRLTTPNLLSSLAQAKGVDANTTGFLMSSISTRGFGGPTSERMLQLVDGMDTQAPSVNLNYGNSLGLPELDLASVELLYGPASALYGANAFNGVLLSTSKDPFTDPGLSVRLRGGNRNYYDAQVRYALRLGKRAAFKITGSYLEAKDWIADTYAAQEISKVVPFNNAAGSPYGYDAVNRYGDLGTTFDARGGALAGKTVFTPGYTEAALIAGDNKTYLFRLVPSFSYLITDKVKATVEFKRAQTTTTLHTVNRFRSKNVATNQYRAELRSDRWFVRAYQTQDFGADSYDLVNLGSYITSSVDPRTIDPTTGLGPTYLERFQGIYATTYNAFLASNPGQETQAAVAAQTAANAVLPVAGSAEFNSLRRRLITDSTPGRGARSNPSSFLSDVSAQHSFTLPFADLILGGAYREFRLGSNGNLYSDFDGQRIRNYEYGGYGQLLRGLFDDRLKLAVAARVDKFRNFDVTFSPRGSAVYSAGANKQHNFRASFGRAFRAPTQVDQYGYVDFGRAVLLGNIGSGYRGYNAALFSPANQADFGALLGAAASGNFGAVQAGLDKYNVNYGAVKPEQVSTVEVGYKALLGERLVVDVNYYRNYFRNFIGGVVLVTNVSDGTVPTVPQFLTSLQAGFQDRSQSTRIVQVQSNINQEVQSFGSAIGLTYSVAKALNLTGNYSYSELDNSNLSAEFQTFFNTPRQKYNLGFNGTALHGLSYSFNYRWAEGHRYETPLANGFLKAYSSTDARVGYTITKLQSTFEIGGSNIFNTRNVQVYGAPQIGRLVYAGLVVDLK